MRGIAGLFFEPSSPFRRAFLSTDATQCGSAQLSIRRPQDGGQQSACAPSGTCLY
jgi:hypothetical protein